ncbi:MAG: hypothetical protein Q8K05_16545 [Polaromonas sp.]|nr:hypothetical protein [Polaromonas sp.]MDP3709016.1 hypothetical protein [Polaromonas sp.]
MPTAFPKNGPLACTALGLKLLRLADKTSSTAIPAVRQRFHPLRNMKIPFLNPALSGQFLGLTLKFQEG